jgi:hypothetical protein
MERLDQKKNHPMIKMASTNRNKTEEAPLLVGFGRET